MAIGLCGNSPEIGTGHLTELALLFVAFNAWTYGHVGPPFLKKEVPAMGNL